MCIHSSFLANGSFGKKTGSFVTACIKLAVVNIEVGPDRNWMRSLE